MTTASEDTLADMQPLELDELEKNGAAVILEKAAEMDKNIPYRERVVTAAQWWGAPSHYPYLVMNLNRRIQEATEKKHREAAGE